MKKYVTFAACTIAVLLQGSGAKAQIGVRAEAYGTAKQAYIYAFPMIAGYRTVADMRHRPGLEKTWQSRGEIASSMGFHNAGITVS